MSSREGPLCLLLILSLVAGTSARVSRQEPGPAEAEEEESRARFRFADRNRNGWISLREAKENLGLDRAGFSRFDADRDGRVTLQEFLGRCRSILRAGAPLPGPASDLWSPPLPAGPRNPLPPWLQPLDRLGKGRISVAEALGKVGGTGAARAALTLADRDGDGALDLTELSALGLAPAVPASAPAARP